MYDMTSLKRIEINVPGALAHLRPGAASPQPRSRAGRVRWRSAID
jgi:hypothetical protein